MEPQLYLCHKISMKLHLIIKLYKTWYSLPLCGIWAAETKEIISTLITLYLSWILKPLHSINNTHAAKHLLIWRILSHEHDKYTTNMKYSSIEVRKFIAKEYYKINLRKSINLFWTENLNSPKVNNPLKYHIKTNETFWNSVIYTDRSELLKEIVKMIIAYLATM